MDIIVEKYDECWEIRFNDTFHVGIVIEDDHAWCLFNDFKDMTKEAGSMRMPDEFFDMIKDEYKIKRPEIEINLEEIEALPWD